MEQKLNGKTAMVTDGNSGMDSLSHRDEERGRGQMAAPAESSNTQLASG